VFSGDVEPRKAAAIRRFVSGRGYAGHRLCSPDYQGAGAGPSPIGADEVVLVTDTVGDVTEAVEAGVPAIGVSWGMHTEQQLLQAGARRVALWPQELLAWLHGDEALEAQHGSAAAAACRCHLPVASGLAVEAARLGALRRTHQLQRRQQAEAHASNRAGLPEGAAGGAQEQELRQALARIMGRPPAAAP